MNLYFRLLWLLLTTGRRAPCDIMGPCRTAFRVWPSDLDVLGHMNNGVYCSLMDLGRVDLMARSGVLTKLRARGWYPVSGEQTLRFRRSLTLGQRFAIETRVLGWDERAFVIGQDFLVPGDPEPVAAAVVRARFLARAGAGEAVGPVLAADVLALAGHDAPSPPLPEWVARWAADQVALRRERRAAPAGASG